MELEDEAEVAVAEVGQGLLGEAGRVDAVNTYGTAVGAVERADNLQQRGLAGTAGPDDADHLAAVDVEVNAFENL